MNIGILQFAGIVFIIIWILALLKKNSEIAVVLIIAASLLMLELITNGLSELIKLFLTMSVAAGLSSQSLKIIVKIIGTGWIADFCSRLCKDQGLDSLSFQVETAGRVLILLEAVPILENLVEYMSGILQI